VAAALTSPHLDAFVGCQCWPSIVHCPSRLGPPFIVHCVLVPHSLSLLVGPPLVPIIWSSSFIPCTGCALPHPHILSPVIIPGPVILSFLSLLLGWGCCSGGHHHYCRPLPVIVVPSLSLSSPPCCHLPYPIIVILVLIAMPLLPLCGPLCHPPFHHLLAISSFFLLLLLLLIVIIVIHLFSGL